MLKNVVSGLGLLSTVVLSACGGGGGGGSEDFVGAADVRIEAVPQQIDTGDRVRVTVEVTRMHEKGIALKVRYPLGLRYVPSSAYLEAGRTKIDATPTNNIANENYRFLVFFLSPDAYGPDDLGLVVFELEGLKETASGEIEVDADVNDPQIDDVTEFDVGKPNFSAVDAIEVRVAS